MITTTTKADWTDAPDWATHTAMDRDGVWKWFDAEPQYAGGYWEPARLGGRVALVRDTLSPWRTSMQERP